VLSDWAALVLAAGSGSRFDGGKMIAPFAGAPLIRRTVEPVVSTGFAKVVVTTGADGPAVGRHLDDLNCEIVDTRDWQTGMAASIRAGITHVPPSSEGVFVFLGDMPLAPLSLCAELAALATVSGYAARPIYHGKPGHPVCFMKAAFHDLMHLTGDQGAGALLKDRSDIGCLHTDDQGAVLDIDTPAVLASAEVLWKARHTSATIDSAISRGDLPKPAMPIGA
jgi:molybdenum cofactor cytidylyltransferase